MTERYEWPVADTYGRITTGVLVKKQYEIRRLGSLWDEFNTREEAVAELEEIKWRYPSIFRFSGIFRLDGTPCCPCCGRAVDEEK